MAFTAQAIDHPGHGHVAEPIPDQRDALPDEVQPIIFMAKRPQHVLNHGAEYNRVTDPLHAIYSVIESEPSSFERGRQSRVFVLMSLHIGHILSFFE